MTRPIRCVLVALLALPSALPAVAQPSVQTIEVSGTVLRAILSDGRTLAGMEPQGAVLELWLAGETDPRHVRLDRVLFDPHDPAGEILLHDMALVDRTGGTSKPLFKHAVDGGHWAFRLRGRWDRSGRRISEEGWTLTCAADAQGKCVRFGYKPWKTVSGVSLVPYQQACVRMVRADDCGNQGTTRDGLLIDLYDCLVIQPRDLSRTDITFEAA